MFYSHVSLQSKGKPCNFEANLCGSLYSTFKTSFQPYAFYNKQLQTLFIDQLVRSKATCSFNCDIRIILCCFLILCTNKNSQGSSEAEFSQLHDNIIRKHMSKLGASSTTNIGISLSLRMLHGHFDQLKREMPLLFSKGVTITRKLGFSDVIMPGEVVIIDWSAVFDPQG